MTRVVALSLVFAAACALTSRGVPRELRYFAPELAPATFFAGPPCGRVRLGHIVADSNLGLALQRRISSVEIEIDETERWAESPDIYARRALVRALFARSLEQAVTGAAPVLDAELIAFEEVAGNATRAGRVVLRYELRDAQLVVARGEIVVVRPANSAAIEAVVHAIADALTAATEQLADRVVAATCHRDPDRRTAVRALGVLPTSAR